MTPSAQSPTAALRSALTAYRAAPAWRKRPALVAVMAAAVVLAEKIATWEGPEGKLEKMWHWLDEHPEHPEHDDREEAWLNANDRYTEARDLLGEAEMEIKKIAVGQAVLA